jgi:hypothetical protein
MAGKTRKARRKKLGAGTGGHYLVVQTDDGQVYIVAPSDLGDPIDDATVKKNAKRLIASASGDGSGTPVDGVLVPDTDAAQRITDANRNRQQARRAPRRTTKKKKRDDY